MRRWTIRLALPGAAFFLALFCCQTATAQMVTIVGVVVDQNNIALPQVSVNALGMSGTATSSSGQFQIGPARVGSAVTLQVQKPGWKPRDPAALRIIVPGNPLADPVRLIMVRLVAAHPHATASPTPAPHPQIDPISVLTVISMVPPDGRAEACRRLLSARQCADFAVVIKNIGFAVPTPAQKIIVDDVVRAGQVTPEQTRELAGCRGDFRFVIINNLLACANGDAIPLLLTRNSSGALDRPFALIIHATGGEASPLATAQLMSGDHDMVRASAHLVVGKSGGIVQLLPFDRSAWHVGASTWHGTGNLNRRTIGIEFVNVLPEPYTSQQIAIAKGIAAVLVSRYGLSDILGHSDVAPNRKTDPGAQFPMQAVRIAAGLPAEPAQSSSPEVSGKP